MENVCFETRGLAGATGETNVSEPWEKDSFRGNKGFEPEKVCAPAGTMTGQENESFETLVDLVASFRN